jgi:hypothetical protein
LRLESGREHWIVEGLQSGCLLAVPTLVIRQLKADTVAFVEGTNADGFDCGGVHDLSLPPSSGSMKPKPFAVLKKRPFGRSSWEAVSKPKEAESDGPTAIMGKLEIGERSVVR